jgi:hypothetical protein
VPDLIVLRRSAVGSNRKADFARAGTGKTIGYNPGKRDSQIGRAEIVG